MTDLLVFVVIVGIAACGGIGFGIVMLAPRITRMLDRAHAAHEEPRDRPD